MLNFVFGLFTGITVGIVGSFVAAVLTMVIVEDSPNILQAVKENLNK